MLTYIHIHTYIYIADCSVAAQVAAAAKLALPPRRIGWCSRQYMHIPIYLYVCLYIPI